MSFHIENDIILKYHTYPEAKMFEFIAKNIYIFWILVMLFLYLYHVGGDDIIFFRKKKYNIDPKAAEKLEEALKKVAKQRNYEVMGPVTVEFEGETHTFDGLLLGTSGTMAISLQPQIGQIYGDLSSDEWAQIWKGDRKTFANPVKAMEGNVKLLRDIYRAEGVKFGTSRNLVVFTNNNCDVAVNRNTPACHVTNLEDKLKEMKFITDGSADIEGMKAAIEKYKK